MRLVDIPAEFLWRRNAVFLMFARPWYVFEWLIKPHWITKYARFEKGEVSKVVPLFSDINCTRIIHIDQIKSSRTFRRKIRYAIDDVIIGEDGSELCREQRGKFFDGKFFFEEIVLKEPAAQAISIPIEVNVHWDPVDRRPRFKKFIGRLEKLIEIEGVR